MAVKDDASSTIATATYTIGTGGSSEDPVEGEIRIESAHFIDSTQLEVVWEYTGTVSTPKFSILIDANPGVVKEVNPAENPAPTLSNGKYTYIMTLDTPVTTGTYNVKVSRYQGTAQVITQVPFDEGAHTTTPTTPTTPTEPEKPSADQVADELGSAVDTVDTDTSADDVQDIILDAVGASSSAALTEAPAETFTDKKVVDALEEINEKRGITESSIVVTGDKSSTVGSATKQWIAANAEPNTRITITQTTAANPVSTNVPEDYRGKSISTVSVVVTFNNVVVNEFGVAFPVILPIPSNFSQDVKDLKVLHYTSANAYDELTPVKDGDNLVVIVNHLSDFAIVDTSNTAASGSGSTSGGGGKGTGGSSTVAGNMTLTTDGHGSLTATPRNAAKGQTVTLRVRPYTGYEFSKLTVTDKSGSAIETTKVSDTQYTFVMVNGKVTVEAEFAYVGVDEDTPTTSGAFSDVPASHTFYNEISWASQNGIMSGYGSGLFQPGSTVTRQQLWMVLGRIAGASPADMAAARTWAMNNGVSDGSSATGAMSRQQLVTMLYRYAVANDLADAPSSDLSSYPDSASVASYAAEALAWAVENGIVGGTSDGRLNPAGTANRGQFAAILYRFANTTGAV